MRREEDSYLKGRINLRTVLDNKEKSFQKITSSTEYDEYAST